MDYQKFIEQLPNLYEHWGHVSVHPKSNQFERVLEQVKGLTTANVMQLLNFAVECMEPEEIYCEVGCFQGATLIGALLDRPHQRAYAVDNFSEFYNFEENFNQLLKNLSKFSLEEQVIFCNQDFEEFFSELREISSETKIGVYFYDGSHDYRSQLLGLLLVKPFLAEQALIIIDDSHWSEVQQASWDFMAANPQCQLLLEFAIPKAENNPFWNGIIVLSWDAKRDYNYDWLTLKQAREEILIEAIYKWQFEFKKQKEEALKKLCAEAPSLLYSEQFTEAEQKYKEILRWEKNNVDAWSSLGVLYYKIERYHEALEMLFRALELDSSRAIDYYNLALVEEKLGDIHQSIQFYQQAITLDPKFIDAYNNLANLLSKFSELEQAESIYRQAIAANPEHFGSYLNLGNLLMSRHQIEDAIQFYRKALRLNSKNSDVFYNLGVAFDAKNEPVQAYFYFGYAYYYQEQYQEAIDQYLKYLNERKTGDENFYLTLADCYKNLNQYEKAISVYYEAIDLYPAASNLYLSLISILQNIGRIYDAAKVASEGLQQLPGDLGLQLKHKLILPILYEHQEEIDFYRQRFTQGLEELIQQNFIENDKARRNALRGIGYHTNFYLPYQGKNDLALQSMYGKLVHNIMAANYPQWVAPLLRKPLDEQRKIRVGYVSAYFRNHNGAKWLIGWLKNHNRQDFEIYCYYTSSLVDQITRQFQIYSDQFHHIPNNLESVCQQIDNDKLHILVFTDIGMEPQTTQMAGLRLAPVQCTAWGHPVTSGLPTIDYYLSSDLMEPEDAQKHYSEQLIRLPNIGICYLEPKIYEPQKNRSYFQIDDDAIVYLCCQSLYKYLPQHDYIFPEIAQRVPEARFVFMAHWSLPITEQFEQRLERAFARLSLNSKDYCLILSRIPQVDYWNLNLLSDVFLDTLVWSGGNTTLEAIACHLPVVTYPGEFMRGRHSYAFLKMLGVTETIASNEAEYIDIAVKLGLNREWRNNIVQKMKDRHSYLYHDKTCVAALEEFYQRVVREGQLPTLK